MVAMLYFSEDGSEIQVEYYSTVKEAYFLEENQFTVKLATVTASEETTPDTEAPTEAPTEEVTEAPSEEATETLTQPETPTEETTLPAPEETTASPTETDAPDGGCGALVGLAVIPALLLPLALLCKKKED